MSLNVNNLPFEIIEKIFEELGKENMIDLMSNIPIVCKTWNTIFNKCIFKKIKYLKFDYLMSMSITDVKVKSIVNKCPGITHADFSYCDNLTDAAVVSLADKCPGITDANFSHNRNLTDAALIALVDKCPGITNTNFWACLMISDTALKFIDIVNQKNKIIYYIS